MFENLHERDSVDWHSGKWQIRGRSHFSQTTSRKCHFLWTHAFGWFLNRAASDKELELFSQVWIIIIIPFDNIFTKANEIQNVLLYLGSLRLTKCGTYYRQDAAKRQTAGNKFTSRPKIRFLAPQGRLVAPIHVKLGSADGHLGPLGCAKSPQSAQGGGNAATKISKISTFW